jgi:hypothetical protein
MNASNDSKNGKPFFSSIAVFFLALLVQLDPEEFTKETWNFPIGMGKTHASFP